ncbi:MAG: endonuclease III [Endomicrobium sp.]|jgi:endonuclease-3|nr:endonuclease III [Endomicrobium sp.]
MKKIQEYVIEMVKLLHKRFGKAKYPLVFSSTFELLVATILSARCTDTRVNKITKHLFLQYRTIADYANANAYEFEHYIKSVGLYRTKTRNIISSAKLIIYKFNGTIPKTFDKLLTLPGVGRKTANIILNIGFNIYDGIAVDTHVIRIAQLLQLTTHHNPFNIEQDLIKIIPRQYWSNFSFLIQNLGKNICTARKSNHIICPILQICKYYNKI